MLLSLIQKRRSIRKFKTEKIEANLIDQIKEAILRAPSSRGINPWEFILIDDPQLLNEVSEVKKHGSSFIKKAPLAIVIIADTTKSDVWVEDTAIAATYIQLMAESLGLGSCWSQIRKRPHNESISAKEYLSNLLSIPKQYEVASIIAIGYPDEDKKPHQKETLSYEKLHHNHY